MMIMKEIYKHENEHDQNPKLVKILSWDPKQSKI